MAGVASGSTPRGCGGCGASTGAGTGGSGGAAAAGGAVAAGAFVAKESAAAGPRLRNCVAAQIDGQTKAQRPAGPSAMPPHAADSELSGPLSGTDRA